MSGHIHLDISSSAASIKYRFLNDCVYFGSESLRPSRLNDSLVEAALVDSAIVVILVVVLVLCVFRGFAVDRCFVGWWWGWGSRGGTLVQGGPGIGHHGGPGRGLPAVYGVTHFGGPGRV